MKSILYVGATLMIGASIYGFVDYKQTRGKKEFKEMYAEEKAPVVFDENENKATEPEPVIKKEPVSFKNVSNNKKVVTKKQAVNKEDEESIISIKPIREDEAVATSEIKEIEKANVEVKTSKDSGTEKKVVKKRKLNTKLFSRGALDERYVEPKVKKETPKEEVKKD
jgi:autonomous glycyl radical cofactor GrcA